MVSAFFLGLLDGTVNSQLYSLIGSVFSDEATSNNVLVVFNIVECSCCAIVFLYTPYLSEEVQILE